MAFFRFTYIIVYGPDSYNFGHNFSTLSPASNIFFSLNFFGPTLFLSHACAYLDFRGFPGGSDDKESACNAGDLGLIRNSLNKGMLPIPVFLPGEFHGEMRLASYSPLGHKESDTTEQLTPSLSSLYLL